MARTADHARIPHAPPNIVLIGLRAAGKSTLGPALAVRLGRAFVELDERTCTALGHATPGAALHAVGIDAFRTAERAALERVLAGRGQVIALGGGTPTAPGAADLLADARGARRSIIIYMRLPVTTLRDRLSHADPGDRPSLTGKGAAEEVGELFSQRDPLYCSLADHVVEADGLSAPELTDRIAAMVG